MFITTDLPGTLPWLLLETTYREKCIVCYYVYMHCLLQWTYRVHSFGSYQQLQGESKIHCLLLRMFITTDLPGTLPWLLLETTYREKCIVCYYVYMHCLLQWTYQVHSFGSYQQLQGESKIHCLLLRMFITTDLPGTLPWLLLETTYREKCIVCYYV